MNNYRFCTDNIGMNIFTSKDRIINSLNFPVTFMSFVFIVSYFVVLIFNNNNDIENEISFLWSVLAGGFVASYITFDSKKTVVVSACVLLQNLIFYAVTEHSSGILISVLFAYAVAKLTVSFDLIKLSAFALLLSLLISTVFALLYLPVQNLLRTAADFIGGNSFLFSFINELYTLTFGNDFSELFYYKDYGSAFFINNEITSGAVNAFLTDKSNPASSVAVYLTGKYYTNIFLPIGLYVCLYPKIKDRFFVPFTAALILSVLCGNNLMFCIFMFFYNPIIYIAYLLCSSLCYLFSNLADVRIGFVNGASVVELIQNHNDMAIFLLIGIVATVLMYFVCLFVLSKYDFDFYRYIPKSVKKLVDALGGEKNILNIDSYTVTVKNPNLVNILNIDCDLHENTVNLIDDDYYLLDKYLN